MQVKNAWSTINGHSLTDIIADFTYRKGSDGQASLLPLLDLFFEQSPVAEWLEAPDSQSWRCCLMSGMKVQIPPPPEFFRIKPRLNLIYWLKSIEDDFQENFTWVTYETYGSIVLAEL